MEGQEPILQIVASIGNRQYHQIIWIDGECLWRRVIKRCMPPPPKKGAALLISERSNSWCIAIIDFSIIGIADSFAGGFLRGIATTYEF
eukprot:scaffold10177_cov250-Chaetoceros_neogracile.AAC.3